MYTFRDLMKFAHACERRRDPELRGRWIDARGLVSDAHHWGGCWSEIDLYTTNWVPRVDEGLVETLAAMPLPPWGPDDRAEWGRLALAALAATNQP